MKLRVHLALFLLLLLPLLCSTFFRFEFVRLLIIMVAVKRIFHLIDVLCFIHKATNLFLKRSFRFILLFVCTGINLCTIQAHSTESHEPKLSCLRHHLLEGSLQTSTFFFAEPNKRPEVWCVVAGEVHECQILP